ARMIRRVGQPNRPGMLAHMPDRRKPQLIGFLQEQVELPKFVPNVLDHSSVFGAGAAADLKRFRIDVAAVGPSQFGNSDCVGLSLVLRTAEPAAASKTDRTTQSLD